MAKVDEIGLKRYGDFAARTQFYECRKNTMKILIPQRKVFLLNVENNIILTNFLHVFAINN